MKNGKWKGMHKNAGASAVYGLGFVGAVIYFIQHATTFWEGVLGILKAIVWPAILIYKLLEFSKNVDPDDPANQSYDS